MPVKVREDKQHVPVSVQVKGRTLNIASIDEVWEIDEEWWRERRIARRYYLVTTQAGVQITIFRDLVGGGWYRQNA
jgi:PHP domain